MGRVVRRSEYHPQPGGETLLSGWLPDQAALRGILDRVFDLNLQLLSVSQVAAEKAVEPKQYHPAGESPDY